MLDQLTVYKCTFVQTSKNTIYNQTWQWKITMYRWFSVIFSLTPPFLPDFLASYVWWPKDTGEDDRRENSKRWTILAFGDKHDFLSSRDIARQKHTRLNTLPSVSNAQRHRSCLAKSSQDDPNHSSQCIDINNSPFPSSTYIIKCGNAKSPLNVDDRWFMIIIPLKSQFANDFPDSHW
jgi:hypothetical protein